MKRLIPYDELKGTRDARRQVKVRAKLKAVNKERAAKKVENEGYDKDYLDWIRKQKCIITGAVTGDWIELPNGTRYRALIVAAHMAAGRTQGTDMTALPVEWRHHDAGYPTGQHRMGLRTWATANKLDIPVQIASHRKRYALECAEKARQKEGKV